MDFSLAAILLLVIKIALVGVALYLVERFIPMSEPIKILIRIIVVIAVILYLVHLLGGL